MKSIISNIRISPKKLNLVAEMVRRKSVVEADSILRFTTKKAAEIVRKALASAVANAENNFKQEKETLFIDEIIVGKGPTLKRFNPVSRGRAHPILKRMSVITTKLGVKGEEPESKKKSKAEITLTGSLEQEKNKMLEIFSDDFYKVFVILGEFSFLVNRIVETCFQNSLRYKQDRKASLKS